MSHVNAAIPRLWGMRFTAVNFTARTWPECFVQRYLFSVMVTTAYISSYTVPQGNPRAGGHSVRWVLAALAMCARVQVVGATTDSLKPSGPGEASVSTSISRLEVVNLADEAP
jgi:hypothetical protein